MTVTEPPVVAAIAGRVGEDRGVRQEPVRRPDAHVQAGGRAAEQVRVRHVVRAVADVGERLTGERVDAPAVLRDRHEVGQDLARVELVGQRVDHRDAGDRGHLVEPLLRVRAPDDRRDLPAEHARRVGDGLALTDLREVAVDAQREAAELGDARGERHLGAQRRLVEDDRDRLRPGQRGAQEVVLPERERELAAPRAARRATGRRRAGRSGSRRHLDPARKSTNWPACSSVRTNGGASRIVGRRDRR